MLDYAQLAEQLKHFPRETISPQGLRQAAVLLPLFRRDDADALLFTVRTDHLAHHSGEISFPGGASETADRNLAETARRETEEELGIPGHVIRILGRLDDCYSIHGYHVVPYVGLIPQPQQLEPDRSEIAAVFEAPLEHFRDPAVHHTEDWSHRGRVHEVDFYQYGEHVIWGMTAGILRQLLTVTARLAAGRRVAG
ncbi:MAG TPA: CoA pyrophosphatase [Desulfuromonadales bacterium]|nr:CoA pyrophosphatase [Desulfuromonadales bacterium]